MSHGSCKQCLVIKQPVAMVFNLQSWTKIVEQICNVWQFFTHAKRTVAREHNFAYPAPPLSPPHLQCWTLVPAISPAFQHCIGWGREDSNTFLKGQQSFFTKFSRETQIIRCTTPVSKDFCPPLSFTQETSWTCCQLCFNDRTLAFSILNCFNI